MTDPIADIMIDVLGKPFPIKCAESQKEYLQKAAEYLSEKMRYFRMQGIIEYEKIAVIAALNIVHQFLTQEAQKEGHLQNVNQRLEALQHKIDHALETTLQMENATIE